MLASKSLFLSDMTATEQEYLKQVYLATADSGRAVHNKELAWRVGATAASATDMVRKLAKKGLLIYHKSRGFELSENGLLEALQVIRRHRLWELFLTDKLGMDWKVVHAIACELQSVNHPELTDGLHQFLGQPVFDPHGEPIPAADGSLPDADRLEVYDLKIGETAKITGYRESSSEFLAYMERLGLLIGSKLSIRSLISYDQSLEVETSDQLFIIQKETAQKIYVDTNANE